MSSDVDIIFWRLAGLSEAMLMEDIELIVEVSISQIYEVFRSSEGLL